ncbi:ABC transporter ATP-binding protein [Salinispira pacifica]|uniref:Branched-chain amino acid transport ATP-binding protein LivG n=1 Tax=Salinispira pacifica TaxID=1307761 RepID=V5WEL6_9SPIO|nr:ABC transporter ATP-binding protein [Salinispira pacifica]AHC14060.1 Branched-chain amino acid transport ATP-binding protein LivG [Salinispira pacifica]
MNENKAILSIDSLTMTFGGLKAVDDLNFSMNSGEIVGLIGPNGAGKTTVFNCVTQFYKEYSGNITIHGDDGPVDLQTVPVTKVIKHGIVRTFQNLDLVPDLSIIDNVLIGAHVSFKTGIISHILKTGKARAEEAEYRQKALGILEFLGIHTLRDALAGGQPYGILKKIEIARALMADPKLMILDEPAAGLNDRETDELDRLIYRIRDEFHTSILLIEHDMGLVMNICDRVCAINFGKFLAMGTPDDIKNDPSVQEAYLGQEDQA